MNYVSICTKIAKIVGPVKNCSTLCGHKKSTTCGPEKNNSLCKSQFLISSIRMNNHA